jgi:hypothetical protein
MNDESTSPPTPQLEPAGSRFVESAARGCLGVVSFLLTLVLFGILAGIRQPAVGFVLVLLAVVALFTARRRSGPSPMLGAVAVGAAIALVISGACMLILLSSR